MTWNTGRKASQVFMVVTMLGLSPHAARAQAETGVESIVTTTVASFALIIVSILVLMIYRKVSQRRRDNSFDTAGLDLMRLKNKGLLTPEEMEKVSKSIARRMEEKEAERRRAEARPTPQSLILDPEVRRLQALAEAREKDARPEADSLNSNVLSNEVRNERVNPPTGDQDGLPANGLTEPDTSQNHNDDEDIELPPEVQQLADAGVLTSEEIENVKRRLRARKLAQ